jgi:hypothetical protein
MTMPVSNDFNFVRVSMVYMLAFHCLQYPILEELVTILGIARWFQPAHTDIQRFACPRVHICFSVCLWPAKNKVDYLLMDNEA